MARIKLIINVVFLVLIGTALSACTGAENTVDPGTTIRIITATPRATIPPTATPTPRVPEMSPEEMAGVELDFWYVAEPYLEDPLASLLTEFAGDN
ncbi:MAG: hypothetical protein ABFS17_14595, partial [Chloroflexota bacterium]